VAWTPSKPENDMLLVNFPAAMRSNLDALELGTDVALLITNAKCSASMGLEDTKLAQITTAAKVSGAAITLLTSVPSGAGVLPDANSNGKCKADAADTTPQYLDSLIDTGMFQISAGDLLQLADSLTYAGNWVNLGSVTTVDINGGTIDGVTVGTIDINGGTMDGVKIGGTTATGEIIINNASDAADGLGVQGSSGQYLKSNGAGVNPSWATPSAGLTSVSQGDLNTASGEVGGVSAQGDFTLPGGTYGFYPQIKFTDTGNRTGRIAAIHSGHFTTGGFQTYRTNITLWYTYGATYARQRYITASGHDYWIFLLVDKVTNKVIGSYQAPDHPSANQGGATEIDIPHPFGSYDPTKHEIIVVDNADLTVMRQRVNRQKSLLQVVNEDYLIDDTKRPKYNPREIVKIDEYGDLPGTVIRKMKTPEWAKIMIGAPDFTLKRQMVEKLPNDILFKKMRSK